MSKPIKHDADKLRYLVPAGMEDQIAEVYDLGARKYGIGNYRNAECLEPGRLLSATRRHVSAWRQGEMNDPETGYHHLVHAAVSLMLLAEIDQDIPKATEQEWRSE